MPFVVGGGRGCCRIVTFPLANGDGNVGLSSRTRHRFAMRFAHCEPVNFNGSIRMIHISNLNKTFGSSKGLSHIESIAKRMIKYLLFARSHEIWQREIL